MKKNFLKRFYIVRRARDIYLTIFFCLIVLFTTGTSYASGNCSTGGVNDASCVNGNIQNLNFGITNSIPWFQSFCGDIRQDNGILDTIPANPVCGSVSGPYAIQPQSNYCPASPGVAFTGNNDASFNSSHASLQKWLVGGSIPSNSEVYKPTVIKTSYNYLTAVMRKGSIPSINMKTLSGCTLLSSCTLPNGLSHGLYTANGTVTLKGYTFPTPPPNQNYVFLINGDLYIQGAIQVPVGDTVTFSVSGSIHVDPSVGESSAISTTSDIEGFYVANDSFIVDGTPGVCTSGSSDNRLNIAGSVVVNAGLLTTPGSFQNNRDLCGQNLQCPAVTFTQRPDLILNAPSLIKSANHLWQEIAP